MPTKASEKGKPVGLPVRLALARLPNRDDLAARRMVRFDHASSMKMSDFRDAGPMSSI